MSFAALWYLNFAIAGFAGPVEHDTGSKAFHGVAAGMAGEPAPAAVVTGWA